MWLLKRTHRHIGRNTLSEYLDGRLQGRDLERVERQLGECGPCRLELEELQATVAMMRQLPMETPRRSFVMSAPPPEPARARPALALRAPNWVYAGAASVAALALAVTVSVDATGGLSSDPLRRDVAVTALAVTPTSEQVTATPEPAAESTIRTADERAARQSMAAGAPTPATADATVREETGGGAAGGTAVEPAVTPSATPAPAASTGAGGGVVATPEPTVESEDAGTAPPSLAAAAPTPAPTADQMIREESDRGGAGASVPAVTPLATPLPEVSAATTAQDSGAIPTESASAEPASTAVAQEARGADGDTSSDETQTAAESQTAKSLDVGATPPVSEPAESAVFDEDGGRATSIWWRVLEVVAGVLAVAFLAGLALRRRASRRDLA